MRIRIKKYKNRSGISAAKQSMAEYLEHVTEINEKKRDSYMRKSKEFKNKGKLTK